MFLWHIWWFSGAIGGIFGFLVTTGHQLVTLEQLFGTRRLWLLCQSSSFITHDVVKIGTLALAHIYVRHQPGGDTLVVFIGDSVVMWQQDGILRAGLERNISQVSNLLPAPTSPLSPPLLGNSCTHTKYKSKHSNNVIKGSLYWKKGKCEFHW